MKRICERCGAIDDEYWMESYNTGRRQIWVCSSCKRKGIREVNLSELYKRKGMWKEKEQR